VEDDGSSPKPNWLERLSALLMRAPEDREQLIRLLHSAFERNLLDGDAANLLTVGPDGLPLLLGFKSQTYNLEYTDTKVIGESHILLWISGVIGLLLLRGVWLNNGDDLQVLLTRLAASMAVVEDVASRLPTIGGLGRVRSTPLRAHHWLLLGIGLTQVPIAAAALALAGCASSPPSSFYTLTATATPSSSTVPSYGVSIGPVTIPETVDRPQLALQISPNQVAFDEFHVTVVALPLLMFEGLA